MAKNSIDAYGASGKSNVLFFEPETGTETQVTYSGRGVLARYKLRRIDGVNILHGDVKLTALVNEVTDKPAVGHIITAPDPITGELQRYDIITASADSAGAAYSIQLRRA
ncbi:hypothetical protein [Klebsiella variicola]|uniref:hypothetical protein n=1 Tax=Klebsiella variicola TaxID=244366 RepID=UPI002FCD689A